MKRTLACRLGIHKWAVRRDPGVKPYVACTRCQKAKLLDVNLENVAGQTEGKMFSPYDK